MSGRHAASGLLFVAALCLSACTGNQANVQMDNPELAVYVQLIMPTRIEIQRHWTKPVSLAGEGDADGLEVILAAYDSFGDNTKMVGTLRFELYTRRMASADRLERRVGFWSVELNSKDSLTRHWDALARFYRFPLQLPEKPLAPGRYILTASLRAPNGQGLVDEYEFDHTAGTAPAADMEP